MVIWEKSIPGRDQQVQRPCGQDRHGVAGGTVRRPVRPALVSWVRPQRRPWRPASSQRPPAQPQQTPEVLTGKARVG